ncbi:alpha/beta hydrolase [Glaciimonas soli]|uniref:Alpha/beta fold hydrolase n=1 Tax=Glaciimonas soli TaxID=2590999 RepID=A0A843YYQ9_9BURK|nr:alpha/beta fold hydrolase [Glaciimonas soli]MQR02401.1 alpha/beta fold hydrolase [Glaciimonas soli]
MEVTTSSVGILLVHGLGGTQYDLGMMGKILKRAGMDTHTLTLPGHAGQPEDLLGVTAEDWVEEVRAKYRELLPQYDTLHVMGMCMGALLAIEVVKQERHTKGRLIALAPPLYLDGWSTPWYRFLRYFVYRFMPNTTRTMKVEEEEPFGVKNELVRSIIKAKFARGDNFHYQWIPLYCVQQVDRLRKWVKEGLNNISCPTLLVHAREDELTSLRSSEFLLKEIGAQHAKLVVLENSYHMICVDNDRDQVAACVLEHLGCDPALVRPRKRRSDVVESEE